MKIPQFQYFGKWQSNYCDDLRRPRRDAPAALQLPENSDLASQEALVRMAVVPLHFHSSGANSVHARFYKARFSFTRIKTIPKIKKGLAYGA